MKKFVYLLFCALTTQCAAQWSEFNQAHPVSCQWPPFNYTAHGYFENVFVVDTLPNFYDGYLVFGNGVLCYPDSCNNYTRCFSAKCNSTGDLVWWNRYDNKETDENQQWFNYYLGNIGGMIRNHLGNFASVFTTFVDGDLNNSETRNYLTQLNNGGEILSQHLIDSSLANYSFNGLIEDITDSTYVAYGWYMDSLDVINNTEPDAFLLKMDNLGNHIWQKTYYSTFGAFPGGLVKAMDGGFGYVVLIERD